MKVSIIKTFLGEIFLEKERFKFRQSNFELLRIIAMFFIVIHHSIVHGILLVSNSTILRQSHPMTMSLFITLGFLGKVGVYLFVLITGYFMINSKISIKKIVKLWLPVFFWSVCLTICIGPLINRFSIFTLIRSMLPIFFNQYWFITTYVFMYLLIPFLNKATLKLSSKQTLLFIIIGLTILFADVHLYGSVVTSWLVKFCIVYCFGGLIKQHHLLESKRFQRLGTTLLWLGLFIDILMAFSSTYLAFFLHNATFLKLARLITTQGLFMCSFLVAIGLFIKIGTKPIKTNYLINTVAATTFGIYLIHDNSNMEKFLWIKVFNMKGLISHSPIVIINVLLICFAIFCVCSLLEFIRSSIFTRVELKIADNCNRIDNDLIDWIIAKLHLNNINEISSKEKK